MASQIEEVARELAASVDKNVIKNKLDELRRAVKDANDTENAEAYRQAAREKYADGSDDDVEIDEDAVVSKGDDDGAFVQAWVWVSDDLLEG